MLVLVNIIHFLVLAFVEREIDFIKRKTLLELYSSFLLLQNYI